MRRMVVAATVAQLSPDAVAEAIETKKKKNKAAMREHCTQARARHHAQHEQL